MSEPADDLIPVEWAFAGDGQSVDPITICRMAARDGIRFAVRRGRLCLSRKGEWAFEPMGGRRTKAFYDRCRFATFDEAAAAAREARGKL